MGPQHPNWKTGLYSVAMPDSLQTRFQEVLGDPELISLRRESALLAMQIQDALAEAEADWGRVNRLIDLRVKTVREEAKRVRDQKHSISLQQHVTIIAALVAAIREVIPVNLHALVNRAVRRLYEQRN